jgi:ABC-type transport system involved in cytochrome bd biosynthesis fused ATPase/permease subunit
LEFQQFDETIFAIPNINIVKQKVDRYKVQYLSLLSPWKSGLLFITAYVIITSYMEWPNWLHIACLWRVYVLGMYKSYIKVITFKQNKFYFFFSVLLFTVSDYSFGMFNLSL